MNLFASYTILFSTPTKNISHRVASRIWEDIPLVGLQVTYSPQDDRGGCHKTTLIGRNLAGRSITVWLSPAEERNPVCILSQGSEWGCAGLDSFFLCSGQYPNGPSEREGIDPDKTLRWFSLAFDPFDLFFLKEGWYESTIAQSAALG